jgi:uncharacterized protein YceK
MDLLAMKTLIICSPEKMKEDSGTSLWLSTPAFTVLSLIFLVDMPFSLVADTLHLPIDLLSDKPKHGNRWTMNKSCDENGSSEGGLY